MAIYISGIIESIHSNILTEGLYGPSGNDILPKTGKTRKLACLNNEILRKGGIILFCDKLCDSMNKTATSSDVEHITWLVVNYIEQIVENIRENPVQDFVMSIHATSAPTSGLLLQAIRSKLSNSSHTVVNTRFLRNVLATVDGVHISQSGKLLDFLVQVFLLSPHLSMTFHANAIICSRLELLLTMTPEEAIMHLSIDEVAAVMELLHRKKLTKRFGKMIKLLNKLAISYNISPLESESGNEYGRTAFFTPGSISNTTLDKQWFLGQTRILCCLLNQHIAGSNHGYVCAKMLATLNNKEEIREIMDLKDFNLVILKECLQLCHLEKPHDTTSLKEVTELTLIRHIRAIVDYLPKDFGFYRPSFWEPSEDDEKYADQLESSVFQDDDIKLAIPSLLQAFKLFINNDGMEEKSVQKLWSNDQNFMDVLTRFSILSLEFSKWLATSSKGIVIIQNGFRNGPVSFKLK